MHQMRQAHTSLQVQTPGRAFVEITRDIQSWVRGCKIDDGLLTVFIRHTSASLLIQENADPGSRCVIWSGSLRGWCPMAIRCSSTAPKAPTTCRRMFVLR